MLTLVINPGGRPRVVSIAEALRYFGLDLRPQDERPERTPAERLARRRELARAHYRERRAQLLAEVRGPER